MTSVSFGGLTFDDGDSRWMLERGGLGGWTDGPPVRGTDTARPAQHGSFGIPGTRGARVVTVNGAVRSASPAEAEAVCDLLSGALADGSLSELAVTSNTGRTLSSLARLNAQPLIDWAPWSNTVRVQFELWAPDPLRYGDPVATPTLFPTLRGGLEFDLFTDGTTDTGFLEFGEASDTGRVVLSNAGTADSWPVFQVDGPVGSTGFDIAVVGTDQRIRFSGPVAAGSVLVIDSASGTAVIDGSADRGGQLTQRDWFPVPAGGSVEVAFLPIGSTTTAKLTVIHRPAFW